MDFKLNPFSDNNWRLELTTRAVFGFVISIYVVYDILNFRFNVQ